MKAIILLWCLLVASGNSSAAMREVDPLDFDDHSNAIFSLQIQVAKLQATDEANQWWLKSLGGGITALAGIGIKLLRNQKT